MRRGDRPCCSLGRATEPVKCVRCERNFAAPQEIHTARLILFDDKYAATEWLRWQWCEHDVEQLVGAQVWRALNHASVRSMCKHKAECDERGCSKRCDERAGF